MKVLHLSAFDDRGGAAKAAFRLHRGLQGLGVESLMRVQFAGSKSAPVLAPHGKLGKSFALLRDTLEPLPLRLYDRQPGAVFSINWVPSGVAGSVVRDKPDLVHLHWINAGFVSIRRWSSLPHPIIWTLHDMWPFTGGCHYAGDCKRFTEHCGRCPQLRSAHSWDLSRLVLAAKKRYLPGRTALVAVAPSRWMAQQARSSRLFGELDIRVIPNGLDLSIYRPVEKAVARRLFNMPDGPLLLFSAAHGLAAPYKGGAALVDILNGLYRDGHVFTLVLMGNKSLPEGFAAEFPIFPLGELHDDISKALAYAAADVSVHSAYQDNLPNTVAESLACGTPVIGTAVGGVPEMVDDKVNGALVPAGDAECFVDSLIWFLSKANKQAMNLAARSKAEDNFDIVRVAAQYWSLYAELVESE